MSPSRCILTFVNFRKGLLLSSRFYGEEIKSRTKQASAMKSCVFNDMHFVVEERLGPYKIAPLLSVKEVTGSHEYLLCTRLIIMT